MAVSSRRLPSFRRSSCDGTAAARAGDGRRSSQRLGEMAERSAISVLRSCETPAGLVRLLLTSRPHPDLCTSRWLSRPTGRRANGPSGQASGLSKADGERLNIAAETHYAACCDAWIASQAGRWLPCPGRPDRRRCSPSLQRFRDHKRSAAPCSISTI